MPAGQAPYRHIKQTIFIIAQKELEMLKTYKELREIDVLPYCETREAKDEKGKKVNVPYLNWAKCKDLLHENGAETVYYEPLVNSNGSTLFMTNEAFTDAKGNRNRCFEVRVKIVIDDLEFVQNYPLLNGVYVVREDNINQLRVSNAQARAFVKGVAIRTGLGFSLWLKDDETEKHVTEDDLFSHDLMKCKKRMSELITSKMQGGVTMEQMAAHLKMEMVEFQALFIQYDKLQRIEDAIRGM